MSNISNKILKGSSLRTLAFFFQVTVAFFLTPFIIHSLGDRLYGLWAIVGAFIGYYGLLDFGLAHAVQRYLSEALGGQNEKECVRIINTALILFIGVGLLVLVLTFAAYSLSDHLASFFKSPQEDGRIFALIILILGSNMAVELPMRVFIGALYSKLRYDIISVLEVMTLLLRAFLIVIALLSSYGLVGIALATVIASIPQKILLIYFARKHLPFLTFSPKESSMVVVWRLFSYSSYSFIWKIGEILKGKLDVMVVGAFAGLSAVTIYSIGSLLVDYFHSCMVASLGLFLPVFGQLLGERNYEKAKRVFFFVKKISMFFSSFIAFGFIAWGKPFIERWMGEDYVGAYPVLVLLVIGRVAGYWQVPSIEYLWTTKGYKIVAIVSLVQGVAILSLSLMLVKPLGIVGVAIGRLVPVAILALVILPIYVSRYSETKWLEYWEKTLKVGAWVFLGLVLPAIVAVVFAASDYGVLTTIGMASGLAYVLIIWPFGFNSSEKRMILEAVGISKTDKE